MGHRRPFAFSRRCEQHKTQRSEAMRAPVTHTRACGHLPCARCITLVFNHSCFLSHLVSTFFSIPSLYLLLGARGLPSFRPSPHCPLSRIHDREILPPFFRVFIVLCCRKRVLVFRCLLDCAQLVFFCPLFSLSVSSAKHRLPPPVVVSHFPSSLLLFV